jgi:predicted transcriptional regulator
MTVDTVDIRCRRARLRATQLQLAGAAGVSIPLLEKLEAGTYQATNSPKRERVLDALDLLENEELWPKM